MINKANSWLGWKYTTLQTILVPHLVSAQAPPSHKYTVGPIKWARQEREEGTWKVCVYYSVLTSSETVSLGMRLCFSSYLVFEAEVCSTPDQELYHFKVTLLCSIEHSTPTWSLERHVNIHNLLVATSYKDSTIRMHCVAAMQECRQEGAPPNPDYVCIKGHDSFQVIRKQC